MKSQGSSSGNYMILINRILIGGLFLIAGLMKAFVSTPTGVAGFFSGLGIPATLFFAWIVMLSEIIFGLSVLTGFKMEYTVYPLIVIVLVAAFLTQWGNWSSFLMHIIVAANLFWYGIKDLKM